jgi:pilus assembly protein CpaE
MARVLLIDDEPIYHKMIIHALKPHGYDVEYAKTGMEGLKAVGTQNPDIIITDVRLPDISGYEIAQRLRRDPHYNSIPIIFLTSQADLSNKLKAFEVGADDYLSKPFQPEELVARMGLLVRRSEALKAIRQLEAEVKDQASIIAVHSLRGGLGCSSMAVNLAMSLQQIWKKPTLLIDAVLNAGQVALMLNASPVHSWSDLTELKPFEIDGDVIETIISQHGTGLHYIAAPTYPIAGDSFTDETWQMALETLQGMYEYIVIDTPHDFSNVSIQMLDHADQILLMTGPEMASVRAAVCALNIYDKLGYPPKKITPIINQISSQAGIKQNQIEKVIKRQVGMVIPYSANEFTRAINYGEPLVLNDPESPTSILFEDTAFYMSKDTAKNIPPAAPTPTWKRVNSRITAKKAD